ncbi:MAG: beta-ketoacyl synthase N-terminal-like domain-containing protein, partial [Desulfobacteraceae bacterium]
ETLPQFWEMLMSKTDQVEGESGRGQTEAGFLNSAVSRFDHQYFNISQAEARTMDPQQILALELTEMLFLDAGIDPQKLDKQRVGVYIGAWNQEYHGDSSSVYYPTGINASIIAGRISYHYDFRGPSWVSNTACSSSLIAVHYAVKDIEAGRIDYAVAGGVNMLLDEAFTVSMQHSGFLSKDFRCKTFDDSANGYVRAEGGALVLLANKELVTKYYARVIGTAINQNGGRAQVITAPHPEAQEELIAAACQDAGIMPQEIAYLECHGTGTKIGDPIEMTAIQNTVGRERGDTLYVGSIKSNLGHLESAAGIAGTIKAVAALNHGIIPPNLHFSTPNQFIDFKSYPISVVSEATPIAHEAVAGISSFGFGGANAHIIIKGAEEKVCKKIQPVQIPFDRLQAASLDTYLKLIESELCPSLKEAAPENTGTDIRQRIQAHLFKVTGISEIDPDLALLDQGLDSMSATELFNHLQEEFKIEIDPEILFDNPLFDQFAAKIKHMINSQPEKKIEDGFTKDNIDQLVAELFFQLTGIKEIDPEVELTDQGLDSMSGAELISQMESGLKIEIGPEILFEYPLREQFVEQIYTLVNQKQT